MKKQWTNYAIDVLITISFLGLAVTGLLKYQAVIRFFSTQNVILPSEFLTVVHRVSGVALAAGVLLHIVLHLKWLVTMTARLIRIAKAKRAARGGTSHAIAKVTGVVILFVVLVALVSRLPEGEPVDLSADSREVESRIISSPADGPVHYEAPARIWMRGLGNIEFDPNQVATLRPDIFAPGSFSVFDILVHLDNLGKIDLEYTFDESRSTHVITSLNGNPDVWYQVVYDGGWSESNVFRMDLYPYKDRAEITLRKSRRSRLEEIYDSFGRADSRGEDNASLTIPRVTISGTSEVLEFENVTVTPHNLRPDLFREGTITAVDVIMSLADQGKLTYDLGWFESIGYAQVVRNYFVQRINNDESHGRCGFVYDAGSNEFYGFRGNHIHLPSDARVLVSPDYVRFFWICV